MKGDILPSHLAVNKYKLIFTGLPELHPTTIGSLEEEIDSVDLPDRTSASGGESRPVEFDITIPAHHHLEIAAMEAWYQQGQEPVDPAYLKLGTLVIESHVTGQIPRTQTLMDTWCFKRATPELDQDNEGEMAVYTYSLKTNRILPA